MISKLSKSEFINRLEKNTKIGDPIIKGTPFVIFTIFGQTNKKFYGQFSKSNFLLTKNAVIFPIPYIFEGKFNSISNASTEISLKVRPIWFGYLWIRILPVLTLIFMNLILVTKGNNIGIEIYFLVNFFLVIMFLPILTTIRQKKKLLKDFYKIFKINN